MRLNCIASLLSGSLVVPSQLWYFTTIFANEKRIRWVLVYFSFFPKQDKIRTLIQSKKNTFLNYVGLPLKRRNYIWIENPPKLILVRNTNLRVIIWRLFIRWPSTLFSFSLTSFLQSFVAPSICFASISMIYLTNMFFYSTKIRFLFFAQIQNRLSVVVGSGCGSNNCVWFGDESGGRGSHLDTDWNIHSITLSIVKLNSTHFMDLKLFLKGQRFEEAGLGRN